MMVNPSVRLVRLIGEGGMGTVWLADHLALENQVVVKLISARASDEDATMVTRFKREAVLAAKIKSPHVVQMLDHGLVEDTVPYIVMEYLEGENLEERLEAQGLFNCDQASILLTHVGEALAKAHALGIVHRDLKPANLFLVESGYELFVKVLDFGIAKHTGAAANVTTSHAVIGTPSYMSPEQLLSTKHADWRTDLWAVGVIMYQVLTGRTPFLGETITALSLAICNNDFPPATHVAPETPPALDGWFRKALHKNPEFRFQSAEEMVTAFAGAMMGDDPSYPEAFESGPYRSYEEPSSPGMADERAAEPAVSQLAPGQQQPATIGAAPYEQAQLRTPAPVSSNAKPRGLSWGLATVLTVVAVGVGVGIFVGWPRADQQPERASNSAKPEGQSSTSEKLISEVTVASGRVISEPTDTTAAAGMIVIAQGKYWIGCEDDPVIQKKKGCFSDEGPGLTVPVTSFAIMKHEVTAQQYDQCVRKGKCPSAGTSKGCTWRRTGMENHPINCVTRAAAQAYCAFRKWRLPTETEWEVAARSGDRRSFPWGDEPPNCKRTVMKSDTHGSCGNQGPAPVGSRDGDQTPAGVADLGGNVREWTGTMYRAYAGGKIAAHDRGKTVNRGGSWRTRHDNFPTSHTRGVDRPRDSRNDLGFRCAAEPSSE